MWAGNPEHKNDFFRSCSLETLAPLGNITNVRFYSLQVGSAAIQGKQPPDNMQFMDVSGELGNFSDTAGLIANLDLVISVDTSVAHLAGAMGKAIWVLLPGNPDWRWMQQRTDSLWYPTMRLFRQQTLGEWEPVVQQMAQELATIVNGGKD